MARRPRQDAAFIADIRAAAARGPHWAASALLVLVTLFLVAGVAWASLSRIEQVVRGQGRVIPSQQVQVVQNLEGGIVSELRVREGQIVQAGEVLLRLDPTRASADFLGDRASYLGLIASHARLTAEIEGIQPVFPDEVLREGPQILAAEQALFRGRQAELRSNIDVLQRRVEQRQQEVAELRSKLGSLQQRYALAREELRITRPNVEAGITSRVELLRLQQDVAELKGEIDSTRLTVPRARAAIREAQQQIDERRERFRTDALDQRSAIEVQLSALGQTIKALEDRVARTEVRSPVDGVVNQLAITTIGGVVKPGEPLLEIVPRDDSLLIEARIRPADIAFIRPGQRAVVRLTAYDFATYGALEGNLEHVSADTIVDDNGESFYQVEVRTGRNYLGSSASPLPIIPGMVAEVDVVTGKRTVLDYLINPLLRVGSRALTEG